MSGYQYNPNAEQWKAIPGFPGYEVSDKGRVRSYWKRTVLADSPQKVLKQGFDHKYFNVHLHKDRRSFTPKIHRLELLTFVGPCPLGMESCHNDGDYTNNDLTNLRWDTHKKNCIDQIQHGTQFRPQGEKHPHSKLTGDQIHQIRELSAQGETQRAIGKRFGVAHSAIFNIVHRIRWPHIP